MGLYRDSDRCQGELPPVSIQYGRRDSVLPLHGRTQKVHRDDSNQGRHPGFRWDVESKSEEVGIWSRHYKRVPGLVTGSPFYRVPGSLFVLTDTWIISSDERCLTFRLEVGS